MSAEQKSTLLRLGGLWETTTKNGTRYLSGRFGNVRLLVFKNPNRRTERDPTHTVCLAEAGERREQPDGPSEGDVPF